MKIKRVFKAEKPIIGMIHLDYLAGQPQFKGIKYVTEKALRDLKALEAGGVDAVLIENWEDNTRGAFVSAKIIACITITTKAIVESAKIPVGINVLPNDFKAAFSIAKACGAKFIQLDVFVDKVKTDYTYSDAKPFEVKVDLNKFKEYRKKVGAENILLLAGIHPKHYKMMEKKSIEQSAREAVMNSADAIVITGNKTGKAPSIKDVKLAKKAVKIPIFIGSGLTKQNATALLKRADGAIVGTAFKDTDFQKVIGHNVKELMETVKFIRR